MRVAHLISTIGPGGAETYVKDLATELTRLGVEQEVWSLTSAERIYRGNPTALCFEREYRIALSERGIETACLDVDTRPNVIGGTVRLRKVARRRNPDIIHVHVYWGLLYGLTLQKHKPFVFTHHGGRLRLAALHRLVFRSALKSYVAICHSDREMISNTALLCSDQIALIQNGINLSRFSVPNRQRDPKRSFRAIAVGRLCAQKNYPMMLRAFRRVVDEIIVRAETLPSLMIVGDGPDREELERLIIHLNLQGCVSLLGIRNDVRELLADSDAFIMSSSWEGMPIVLLEALSSGLPIISTAVDGTSDVIQDGQSGILVRSGDDDALAHSILRLIYDIDLWRILVEGAVARSAEFSVKTAAERHIELYDSIMEK